MTIVDQKMCVVSKQVTMAFNKNILMKTNTQMQNRYGVPIAIVVAGLLIAGAVFWTGGGGDIASNPTRDTKGKVGQPSGQPAQAGEFRIPDETDHVQGNPDAPITIVEFSDLECPFCARIHPTLKRIVEENEDVRWVFRHFPLSTIHSRALSAAVASECIARLGTNDNFWTFIDEAFVNQRKLGDTWYREMALSFGIDSGAFAGCVNDKGVVADIQTDLDEATSAGGRGTPYVVVITPTGQLVPFSGALPYEQVSAVIEQARNN